MLMLAQEAKRLGRDKQFLKLQGKSKLEGGPAKAGEGQAVRIQRNVSMETGHHQHNVNIAASM